MNILIGLPHHYAHLEPEVLHNLYQSLGDPSIGVMVQEEVNSQVEYGYNRCFAAAINQGADAFLLMNADAAPGPGFLRTIITEAEGYDVMHVTTSMKDDSGLTSTAVGELLNEWALARHVTLAELALLPLTFGHLDVLRVFGRHEPWDDKRLCLLPSCNCLFVRMSPKMKTFPGFDQHHRISMESGKAVAECVSEDWAFGRWCAQNGFKVGGTKKVAIDHIGRAKYSNQLVRGQRRDEAFLIATRSV